MLAQDWRPARPGETPGELVPGEDDPLAVQPIDVGFHVEQRGVTMAIVRAKFYCQSGVGSEFQPGAKVYSFMAAYDDGTPENQRYAKATPTGSLSITVDNPEVSFEAGKYYYLDFSPAD